VSEALRPKFRSLFRSDFLCAFFADFVIGIKF